MHEKNWSINSIRRALRLSFFQLLIQIRNLGSIAAEDPDNRAKSGSGKQGKSPDPDNRAKPGSTGDPAVQPFPRLNKQNCYQYFSSNCYQYFSSNWFWCPHKKELKFRLKHNFRNQEPDLVQTRSRSPTLWEDVKSVLLICILSPCFMVNLYKPLYVRTVHNVLVIWLLEL